MRNLPLFLLLFVKMSGFAQSQPPYNPDFDNDGVITSADIMQLLPMFGQPFTPEPCPEIIEGCTDSEALNFNPEAAVDDGSCIIDDQPEYPEGSVFCNGTPTEVVEVLNPVTGRIWMDRNLGASQAATSSTDEAAFGDLYQWGRGPDGHQCRTSNTTSTLSSTDAPSHGNFILATHSPYDWRSLENNNLWQGANGANNPCPSGYRLPTEAELLAERNSWITSNAEGALNSPLKLPIAGYRSGSNGSLVNVGTAGGYYWSSTVSGTGSRFLSISTAGMFDFSRASGLTVRCLKD